AAESAGGVRARILAHLQAGCDVVLVCPPALVPASLEAMEEAPPTNAAALTALLGRGGAGWDSLLAQPRYDQARARLAGPEGVACCAWTWRPRCNDRRCCTPACASPARAAAGPPSWTRTMRAAGSARCCGR